VRSAVTSVSDGPAFIAGLVVAGLSGHPPGRESGRAGFAPGV